MPLHYVYPAMLMAAFLKGITGLGFSTICLGLLASIIDLRLAIPLVLLPSLSSNAMVMWQAGQFRPTLLRFRMLYLAAIPGLVIGLWVLGSAAPTNLAAWLGIVLAAYAVFALINPAFALSKTWARRLAAPAGFLTGIVNGATGSQVMPALPYLMSLNLPREVLVQAINISFTLGSLVMAVGLAKLGFLDFTMLAVSLGGILLVWAGITAGGWIRVRLPERWFRIGVLVMLIGLGTNLALPLLP